MPSGWSSALAPLAPRLWEYRTSDRTLRTLARGAWPARLQRSSQGGMFIYIYIIYIYISYYMYIIYNYHNICILYIIVILYIYIICIIYIYIYVYIYSHPGVVRYGHFLKSSHKSESVWTMWTYLLLSTPG